MKLIIFGATGTIGKLLVKQALEKEYQVSAYVRTPEKVNMKHANLTIIQGNVLDPVAVEKAIAGHDSVFCALGAGSEGTVRTEGTRNIIRAMEKTGVQRLICLSTLGAGKSRNNLNFFWKYIMFGLLLRKAYNDHLQQEDLVKHSPLQWTIVRPSAFTNGEITGVYKHGFSFDEKNLSLKISRMDVADFMLKQLTDDTYIHDNPGLSY
ncbi:MAG: SDR family oxidoreductase [Balneolaceae bacterium]|nr:SDR family oxidoreductase [Balneolaceae bacterium]